MMDYSSFFPALHPDSRIWVYVASAPLTAEIEADLSQTVRDFAASWSSHGRIVISDFSLADSQILILGAFVQQGEISGCGIDKSLHVLDQFAQNNGFDWVNALSVLHRNEDGTLEISTRGRFRDLVKTGVVSESTTVLDTSITALSELRNGRFELMAGMSWHAGVFQIPASMPQ